MEVQAGGDESGRVWPLWAAVAAGCGLLAFGSGVLRERAFRSFTSGPPGGQTGGVREVLNVSWVAVVAGAVLLGIVAYRHAPRSRVNARLVGTSVTAVIGIGFALWDLKQGGSGPLLDEWSDGRPVRDDDGAVLLGTAPAATNTSAGAAYWLEASRHEASSVATFEILAHHLALHGATAGLVTLALDAADDERNHELVCRQIARKLGADVPAQPSAQPNVTASPAPSKAMLAVAAYNHGVIGEGFAVERLACGTEFCNPDIAHLLKRLETDERRHVELGRATIQWALDSGDEAVAAALSAADSNLPTQVQLPRHLSRISSDERRNAGICQDHQIQPLWGHVVARERVWLASQLRER